MVTSKKSWTVRLAGACVCFSEKSEEGTVNVAHTCIRAGQCQMYDVWNLLQASTRDDSDIPLPPMQVPFARALLKTGLYTRSEIISALCEVFRVKITRADNIWARTVAKLKDQGVQCLTRSDDKTRYLMNQS